MHRGPPTPPLGGSEEWTLCEYDSKVGKWVIQRVGDGQLAHASYRNMVPVGKFAEFDVVHHCFRTDGDIEDVFTDFFFASLKSSRSNCSYGCNLRSSK